MSSGVGIIDASEIRLHDNVPLRHAENLGGADPSVRAAGIVDIRGGRIFSVDDASGHFKHRAGELRSRLNSAPCQYRPPSALAA